MHAGQHRVRKREFINRDEVNPILTIVLPQTEEGKLSALFRTVMCLMTAPEAYKLGKYYGLPVMPILMLPVASTCLNWLPGKLMM